MIYKFLINTVQIIFSGYMIFVILESLKVSGPKPNYLSLEALPFILAYLSAYLFVIFILSKHKELLNIISLIIISLLGSLIFTIYSYMGLNYSKDADILYIAFYFGFFGIISEIFFMISAFMTVCSWIIKEIFKIIKQRVIFR